MHDLLRRHNPCSRIHRRSSPRTVAIGLATDHCLISVHGSGVFFCSSSLLGCSVHLLWISLVSLLHSLPSFIPFLHPSLVNYIRGCKPARWS
ncbi:hypothetical protein EE612_043683 [Oryza sativa]|nr:hypothetical protein EE612_043683 [Oryza sativa]